jgi:hypothetical protein
LRVLIVDEEEHEDPMIILNYKEECDVYNKYEIKNI